MSVIDHPTAHVEEDRAITELIDRLRAKHTDIEPHRVAEVVRSVHARFEQATVRDFIPLLVERSAEDALHSATS